MGKSDFVCYVCRYEINTNIILKKQLKYKISLNTTTLNLESYFIKENYI